MKSWFSHFEKRRWIAAVLLLIAVGLTFLSPLYALIAALPTLLLLVLPEAGGDSFEEIDVLMSKVKDGQLGSRLPHSYEAYRWLSSVRRLEI